MTFFVIGLILDAGCAAVGVFTLLRLGRCTRGRLVVGSAGAVLILYGLISIPWRLWITFGTLTGAYDTLSPILRIGTSLVLTAAIVLYLIALVIRGRELAPPKQHRPQPSAPYSGAQYGAAYGTPGQYQQPQQQPPQRQAWPVPHGAAPQDQRSAPGQWAPPHGAPPPETPEGGAR